MAKIRNWKRNHESENRERATQINKGSPYHLDPAKHPRRVRALKARRMTNLNETGERK
jgi:hypothetical protein